MDDFSSFVQPTQVSYPPQEAWLEEIYTRLRWDPFNASRGERDAVCEIVREDPSAYNQAIADREAEGNPRAVRSYLESLLKDYRGKSVGGEYVGR